MVNIFVAQKLHNICQHSVLQIYVLFTFLLFNKPPMSTDEWPRWLHTHVLSVMSRTFVCEALIKHQQWVGM